MYKRENSDDSMCRMAFPVKWPPFIGRKQNVDFAKHHTS